MKRKININGIGYYLSCMMLFNAVYAIKILNDGLFQCELVNWKSWEYIVDFSTFIICILFLISSVVFTILIVVRDDSITEEAALGKKVEVSELEDLTGENYFTNYSVLVLTGLSLPVLNNVYSLLLYLLIFVTMGTVYIKKGLIYMNPILTVLDFSTYRCSDAKSSSTFIFVVRNSELKNGQIVRFQNTTRRIIRLNKIKSTKESVNDTGDKETN